MKIRAFFFDIDGTFYNYKAAQEYAVNELSVMANRLTNIPPELFRKLYYRVYKDVIALSEKEGPDIFRKEIMLRRVFSISTFHASDRIIKFLAEKYYEKILKKTVAFEDARETLIFLKNYGFKLGVISDGFREIQLARLKKLGLLDLFDDDSVVISEDIGVNKPSPKIFLEAFRRLNVYPQESVVVGDNLVKDNKTAKKLGALTIWINRYMSHSLMNTPEVDYADFMVRNLREICIITQKFILMQ